MQSKKMFTKILVPTDGSKHSLIAQELTAFLAKKFDSKVTVLHIVSHEFMNVQVQKFFVPTDDFAPVGVLGAQEAPVLERVPESSAMTSQAIERAREITDSYHEKGKQVIADAVAFFKDKGIPVEQKIVEHVDPAETILNEAQKGNFDLIVMGRSGEEEQEPHLGSVAKKVSNHAQIPILLAREERLSKILAPVDGSKNAEKAVQYAAFLAEKTNAEMALLYVQESHLFRMKPDMAKEVGTRILSKAANQTKAMKLEQKLKSGDPAKTIIQTASNEGYDIIVIGSKGHSAIERFLLGSVCEHVIHYADRSVLIVR